jgi:hypothetical protein
MVDANTLSALLAADRIRPGKDPIPSGGFLGSIKSTSNRDRGKIEIAATH